MNDPAHPERPLSKIYETLPGAYFREAADFFSRAAEKAGSTEVTLSAAGMSFRLRFAGEVARPLILPTLAHHRVDGDSPADWTLHCWDDASTGSVMPLPTPQMRTDHRRNCLFAVSDQRYRAFYQEWMETLMFIDREGSAAYGCYLNAPALPMYEKAAPLRQIFNTAFNMRDRQIVHAAAVGYPEGSVLLAGPPRSGKSTLAVQCLLQGMGYQSDDLCVISQDNPPRSWSLYNVAKLRADSLSRVSKDLPLRSFTEGKETKHYFHVNEVFPERILPSAPLKALVIPQITRETTSRLRPATRLDAVKALIPWSVNEVPTSDNLGEKIMLKVLGHLPAYRLELGADEKQTFELLHKLIHES